MATHIVDSKDVLRAMENRPGGDDGLSVLDKKILEAAAQNKSPEEIAALAGTTPERAAQRVREILKTRDWLSIIERKQLLMNDFYDLRAYLVDMMEADRNPNEQYDIKGHPFIPPSDPRWAANMNVLLKELRRIIEADEKVVKRDVDTIHQAQANLMVRAIGIAFNRMVTQLTEHYPELDPQIAYDLMESALPHAMSTVEDRVAV